MKGRDRQIGQMAGNDGLGIAMAYELQLSRLSKALYIVEIQRHDMCYCGWLTWVSWQPLTAPFPEMLILVLYEVCYGQW